MGASAVLVAIAVAVASDRDALETVRVRAFAQVQRLHSIQFSATSRGVYLDNRGEECIRTSQLRFVCNDLKYRAEARIEDRCRHSVVEMVSAFDGQRYQVFLPTTRTLGVSTAPHLPNASVDVNPLVLPYGWVHRPGRLIAWETIQNTDAWREAFADAVWVGTNKDKDNDRVFWLVDFAGLVPDTRNRVWFAEHLDFYPLRAEGLCADGNKFYTQEVAKYHWDPVQKIVVPLLIVTHHDLSLIQQPIEAPKRLDTRYEIDVASVRVNREIDQSVFTISPRQAAVVNDLDVIQRRFRPLGVRPISNLFRVILIIANVALIAGALFIWALRKRRARRT